MLFQIVLHLGLKWTKLTLEGIILTMRHHVNPHFRLLLHFSPANIALEWPFTGMLQVMPAEVTFVFC